MNVEPWKGGEGGKGFCNLQMSLSLLSSCLSTDGPAAGQVAMLIFWPDLRHWREGDKRKKTEEKSSWEAFHAKRYLAQLVKV